MAQFPLFGVAIGIGIGIVSKVFGSIPIAIPTPTPTKIIDYDQCGGKPKGYRESKFLRNKVSEIAIFYYICALALKACAGYFEV